MQRSSGILLPIFSLASPFGCGTIGHDAYKFIDYLAAAGQSYWQMLPLGIIGSGNSPYQSCSSFAGNPNFIDPVLLWESGLITSEEILSFIYRGSPLQVDYSWLDKRNEILFTCVAQRIYEMQPEAVTEFYAENSYWLDDFSLYAAVKRYFGGLAWYDWPEPALSAYDAAARTYWSSQLATQINEIIAVQYLFNVQWQALKQYAEKRKVYFIGDLPIYTALDSADVWSNRRFFQLDDNGRPLNVAGVPPDAFSSDGQIWGNPLYDWETLHADGYGWWIRRIAANARWFDALRIDHFRGLESYWSIPGTASSAASGCWQTGPGKNFVRMISQWFSDFKFIAEDLGEITPAVRELLDVSGWPGMKVLQFAFDNENDTDYLPHNFMHHTVCYTGTHDNDTLIGWLGKAAPERVAYAREYFGLANDDTAAAWGMICGGMRSAADLFIAPMADFLGLGSEARINIPGTVGENWRWRLRGDELTASSAARLRRITQIYGRLAY